MQGLQRLTSLYLVKSFPMCVQAVEMLKDSKNKCCWIPICYHSLKVFDKLGSVLFELLGLDC